MLTRNMGLLLTTTASMVWGTTFVAADFGLRYTNPYNLLFMRFAVASAVAVPLAIAFGRLRELRGELERSPVWLLGVIYAMGFLLQYMGQSLTNVGDATLLANLAPVFVPGLAWFITKESITKSQIPITGLGLLGLVLIVWPDFGLGSRSLVGDLLLFGASMSYALFVVMSKRLNAVSVGSGLALIVAVTVFLAPAAILLGKLNPLDLEMGWTGWLYVVYLGVPCTVIAVALYLKGMGSISASTSGMILLVEILTGLLLATLLFRQVPTEYELGASVAVLSALGMSIFSSRQAKSIRTEANMTSGA